MFSPPNRAETRARRPRATQMAGGHVQAAHVGAGVRPLQLGRGETRIPPAELEYEYDSGYTGSHRIS